MKTGLYIMNITLFDLLIKKEFSQTRASYIRIVVALVNHSMPELYVGSSKNHTPNSLNWNK